MAGNASFGHLLRQQRRFAGLTQEELAERAGLSAFAISALERGASQSPREDTLALLAEALALSEGKHARLLAAMRRQGGEPARASSPDPAAPSGPALLGRARELDVLERSLAGQGPPLLFAGEPGIGKSRLLAVAAQRGAKAGWYLLASGCTVAVGRQSRHGSVCTRRWRSSGGSAPSRKWSVPSGNWRRCPDVR